MCVGMCDSRGFTGSSTVEGRTGDGFGGPASPIRPAQEGCYLVRAESEWGPTGAGEEPLPRAGRNLSGEG